MAKKPEEAVFTTVTAAKKFKSQIARPVSTQKPVKEEVVTSEEVMVEAVTVDERKLVEESVMVAPNVMEAVEAESEDASQFLKDDSIVEERAEMAVVPVAVLERAAETFTTNKSLEKTPSMEMRQVAEQVLDSIIAEAVIRNSPNLSLIVPELAGTGDALSGIASGEVDGISDLVQEALGFDRERLLEALHQGFPKMKVGSSFFTELTRGPESFPLFHRTNSGHGLGLLFRTQCTSLYNGNHCFHRQGRQSDSDRIAVTSPAPP